MKAKGRPAKPPATTKSNKHSKARKAPAAPPPRGGLKLFQNTKASQAQQRRKEVTAAGGQRRKDEPAPLVMGKGGAPATKQATPGKPAASSPGGAGAALAARLARASAEQAKEETFEVRSKAGPSAGALPPGGVQMTTQEEEIESPLGPVVVRKASAPQNLLPEEMRPKGGPAPPSKGDDLEGAKFVVAGGKTVQTAAAEGVHVVAKGPSKFSMADLELLKRVVQVKGSVGIVDGFNLEALKYDNDGLVPVIQQDRVTGAVLGQAWANRDALEQTLRTKRMTYYSRSQNKLQVRGEAGGTAQTLVKLLPDCDSDSVLAIVDQQGAACHRDTGTCWNDSRAIPIAGVLGDVDRDIASKSKKGGGSSQTGQLLKDPVLALKKVVEDTKNLVESLKGTSKRPLEAQAAELMHNILVACRGKGVGLDRILAELGKRGD